VATQDTYAQDAVLVQYSGKYKYRGKDEPYDWEKYGIQAGYTADYLVLRKKELQNVIKSSW